MASTAPASQRDSIRLAIAPMYESEDGAVQWADVPRLSRDTLIRNLTTGELVTQTPHLVVTPDEQRSNDFANLWSWSREYRFEAPPPQADAVSLGAYRTQMDAATRPAWNHWAAQNQAYYRSQGIGVDLGREGVRLEGRNDWRDIKAMGTFIRGGIESSLNGVAMLAQMSPLGIGAYMARGEFWQPFEIEGPLEQAGEISFGVASLFVGGTPLLAGKAAPRLGGAGPLSRRINSWADLGVPSAPRGLDEVANRNLGLVELDPRLIRTTQTTVKQQGETLPALIESMKQNGFVVEPKRLIDVVRMPDGQLTSLDTTRILAADRAGINVQARLWDHADLLPDDVQFVSRFIGRKGEVPVTFGDAVMNRVGRQNGAYPELYPYGSPYVGTKY